MSKLNEYDSLITYLATRAEWVQVGSINNSVELPGGIQQRADRRMGEIFGDTLESIPSQIITREVAGAEFVIETKKEGGLRYYRAYKTKDKPIDPRLAISRAMEEKLRRLYGDA